MRPIPHEQTAIALQCWLWECAQQGWDYMGAVVGGPVRWSHDDNMLAMPLGWMIVSPPGSIIFDLFSLKPGVTPPEIMSSIVASSPIIPLCAKALSVLAAQRLLHPDTNFAFLGK